MLEYKFNTSNLKDISHVKRNDVVKLRCGVNCKRGESQYFIRGCWYTNTLDGCWYTNIPDALQIFGSITFTKYNKIQIWQLDGLMDAATDIQFWHLQIFGEKIP